MNLTKRRIGISYTRTRFEHYWNWLTPQELGSDLELVLLSFEQNNVEDIYTCDGFILTGGVDVHPSYYKGRMSYPHAPAEHEQERDAFEQHIFQFSQLHRLPLLAVCRGLQLVNVLAGGQLVQDLGEGNAVHMGAAKDGRHLLDIVPGTLLHQICGDGPFETNSAHHQVADPHSLGENLMVNCVSARDGVVEGIEWKEKKGKAFFLGVQWHPERIEGKEDHPLSQKIKERFVQEVKNVSRTRLTVMNPATGEAVAELVQDTTDTLQQKYARLSAAQPRWAAEPLHERVAVIEAFGRLLQENAASLAQVLTSEVGKPLQQSRNEIAGAVSRINWLAGNAAKYLAPEIMTDEAGLQEKIVYEPLGVVCNISAWNYPFLVGVNVFVPALLGGNAVLYKPSEYASLTGLQIKKWLTVAGVPDDVFEVAIGGGNIGEQLLDLPFDGYFFTGSNKTGRHIYERVAAKMVPCQCELGGKDPLYVADDVQDITATAAAVADGAFYNAGQSCCAVERVYVQGSIYDRFVDAFCKEVKSFKLGLPTEDGVYLGPLTRKEQVAVLQQQVDGAEAKGATVLVGGHPVPGPGYYFQPTVLINVNHEMAVMKDESFGPVIGLMRVADDAEAVSLMNDTDYGLTAAVYSSNQERAEKILSQLNTGTAYWNCCDRVSAALPWSGRKKSGFGSTLSHHGLRAFVRPKAFHLRK